MGTENNILIMAAMSLGFFHTLLGPDHYLPFIMLSRLKKWSIGKTAVITVVCGLGHVASSAVVGVIGLTAGTVISKLDMFEGMRGVFAAYLLFSFGLVYTGWGIFKAAGSQGHNHTHSLFFKKRENMIGNNLTDSPKSDVAITWWLFIIFLFGPCEPLIPILMYPAAKSSVTEIFAVTAVFAFSTIATMTLAVLFASYSVKKINLSYLEKYSHAIGGCVITLCGAGMVFLDF